MKTLLIALLASLCACAKPTDQSVNGTAPKPLASVWTANQPGWTIDLQNVPTSLNQNFILNASLIDNGSCQGSAAITDYFDNMAHDTASGTLVISGVTGNSTLCSQFNQTWDYYVLDDGLLLCIVGVKNSCLEFH